MIRIILILLLWASPALADPKNYLPQSETPVAARCVTADGLSYESCGGSLTLNGADGAINDGANDTIKATVKDYTNSNPLTTIIVDTNGDPASIGGGTQYNQGTASTDTDTMTMAGCVRVDTPAVATGVIDGDRARCMVDSTGRLWVHVGVIDGTVAVTQSGTWNITTLTGITNPVAVTGTFWQATQPVSAASLPLPTGAATAANQDGIIKDGTGDTTQANVSSGNLHVAVQGTATVSGTVTVTDGAGALNVICDSGCSGGTQYDEDTVHASGDKLTMAGVVRKDSNAALAADGDNTVLQVDANGYLKVVNINPNLAADNSTLSTSKVPVLPGTVSTSAPTWTNGNQSALSLQTDGSVRSAVTNTVTVTASNLDVQIGGSDSLTIGTFPDNEPFNIAQMNGVTVSMGVGASGTGTQRVASLIHDGTDTAQVTATAGGSLQVECTSGCGGSGGTSIADDAAFTPGTTSVTPAGAMFDDVTPDSVNEGDAGVVRMSANRNLYTTLRDAAGNERGANVNASGELQVAITANSAVNVAQINGVTPLMGAGNTGTGSHRVTEATDSQLSAGVGATGDAAATAGGTGSINSKLRLMSSQLDSISTNLSSLLTSSQLVDDDQTGASVHYRTSVGSSEDEHEVKGSAGRLFSITATNTNAAVRYLRCANQVIGSTTPGTTTVLLGLAIPGATTGAGFTTNFGPAGIAFSTGLTCWLVTGAADTDVAEVAANEIKVIYTYK